MGDILCHDNMTMLVNERFHETTMIDRFGTCIVKFHTTNYPICRKNINFDCAVECFVYK